MNPTRSSAHPCTTRALPLFGAFCLSAALLGGCIIDDRTLADDRRTAQDLDSRVTRRTADQTKPADGRSQITLREIDSRTNAFADRWASLIQDATDELLKQPLTAEQRLAAQSLRVQSAISVYDIAVNPDAIAGLLDMVVLASLEERVWVGEGEADRLFGPSATPLVRALRSLRADIWLLAINAMTGEQVDSLGEILDEWRTNNPTVKSVAFVRFSEFAANSADQLAGEIKSSGFLAPLDEATRAIEEVRQLGERGIWLGTRAPIIVSWQLDAAADQLLLKPDVQKALEASSTLAGSADRLSKSAAALPDQIKAEREAFFAQLDEREKALTTSLNALRSSITEGQRLLDQTQLVIKDADSLVVSAGRLTAAVNDAIRAADLLAARFDKPGAQPGKPFDIVEYTRAAEQLTSAVKEANALLNATNSLMTSQVWTTRLDEIDRLGARQLQAASIEAASLTNSAFVRALLLLGIFFAGSAGLLVLWWRLASKKF